MQTPTGRHAALTSPPTQRRRARLPRTSEPRYRRTRSGATLVCFAMHERSSQIVELLYARMSNFFGPLGMLLETVMVMVLPRTRDECERSPE